MKTQNLAVMFTDIQGFTARTSQQTREENPLFLRLHVLLGRPRAERLIAAGRLEEARARRGNGALGETRSRDALRPLRALAEAEPEEPETSDPLEKVKRFFGAGGRCGAGDLAREAIRDIEEGRRVE